MLGCKGLTFSAGKTIFNQTDHRVLVRKSIFAVVIGSARFILFSPTVPTVEVIIFHHCQSRLFHEHIEILRKFK